MPFFAGATWFVISTVVAVAAFVIEAIALFIAVRTPAMAYQRAGKLSKPAWVAITAVAAVIGLSALPFIGTGRGFGELFSIASVVAAIVFLVDVRPAVVPYYGSRRPPRRGQDSQGGW
jgi:cytochrome bd-type quinol oxidase subunit 2